MPIPAAPQPDWRLGFQSLETEYVEPVVLPVQGVIPKEVRGTLYRVGPARHVVFGEPLRHWFDGDGMMHSFSLTDSQVQYRCRFVNSQGHQEEERAQRRIFRSFGTPPSGGPIARFRHRKRGKNTANTSMIFHAGELWAALRLLLNGFPLRLAASHRSADPSHFGRNGSQRLPAKARGLLCAPALLRKVRRAMELLGATRSTAADEHSLPRCARKEPRGGSLPNADASDGARLRPHLLPRADQV